jgi:hypothetical protein
LTNDVLNQPPPQQIRNRRMERTALPRRKRVR